MEILTDWRTFGGRFGLRKILQMVLLGASISATAWAQSPWENAVNVLQAAFPVPL